MPRYKSRFYQTCEARRWRRRKENCYRPKRYWLQDWGSTRRRLPPSNPTMVDPTDFYPLPREFTVPPVGHHRFLRTTKSDLTTVNLDRADFLHRTRRCGHTLTRDAPHGLTLLINVGRCDTLGVPGLGNYIQSIRVRCRLLIRHCNFGPDSVIVIASNSDLSPAQTGVLRTFRRRLVTRTHPNSIIIFRCSNRKSQIRSPGPVMIDRYNPGDGPGNVGNALIPNSTDFAQVGSARQIIASVVNHDLFLLARQVRASGIYVILSDYFSKTNAENGTRIESTAGSHLDSKTEVLQPDRTRLRVRTR